VEHSTCFASPEFRAEVRRQVLKFLGVKVGPRAAQAPLASPVPTQRTPTRAPADPVDEPPPALTHDLRALISSASNAT